MRKGDMSNTMESITSAVMDAYLRRTLTGTIPTFSAPYVAKQLASIFVGCCYRIERVQQAAMLCADRIIRDVPSALCQKTSLFALLELLSLMWTSCLVVSSRGSLLELSVSRKQMYTCREPPRPRLLCSDPRPLILCRFDEPSSYLDVKQRLSAALMIRSLLSPDNYVIAVEHVSTSDADVYLRLTYLMCHRICPCLITFLITYVCSTAARLFTVS